MKACVISCVFNAERFIQQHLDSVRSQKGCEYIHIVIDDGSTDGTSAILQKHHEKYATGFNDYYKFILISKPLRTGATASFLRGVSYPLIEEEDILVELDGDDYFKHDGALARIVKEYQTGCLATYGNYVVEYEESLFKSPPPKQLIESCCKPSVHRNIRTQLFDGKWIYSAVRSVKKWVFDRIPHNYFLRTDGAFIKIKDLAYFTPVIELVGWDRLSFIDEKLMIYNLHQGSDIFGDMTEARHGIGSIQQYNDTTEVANKPPLRKLPPRKGLGLAKFLED